MMLPPEPDRWTIDLANAQRMEAIAAFGFTERQARFLLNVLLHSGVFVERQYCSFAGIVHGQKSTDFIKTLVELCRREGRGRTRALPSTRREHPVHSSYRLSGKSRYTPALASTLAPSVVASSVAV